MPLVQHLSLSEPSLHMQPAHQENQALPFGLLPGHWLCILQLQSSSISALTVQPAAPAAQTGSPALTASCSLGTFFCFLPGLGCSGIAGRSSLQH